MNREELHFTVYGNNADDIRKKAEKQIQDYFGDNGELILITAHPYIARFNRGDNLGNYQAEVTALLMPNE